MEKIHKKEGEKDGETRDLVLETVRAATLAMILTVSSVGSVNGSFVSAAEEEPLIVEEVTEAPEETLPAAEKVQESSVEVVTVETEVQKESPETEIQTQAPQTEALTPGTEGTEALQTEALTPGTEGTEALQTEASAPETEGTEATQTEAAVPETEGTEAPQTVMPIPGTEETEAPTPETEGTEAPQTEMSVLAENGLTIEKIQVVEEAEPTANAASRAAETGGSLILGQSEGSRIVPFGESITFSVTTASDKGNLTYAWYKEGDLIDGALEASYTVEAVEENATYFCRVTDENGNFEEAFFSVNVDAGLKIQGEEFIELTVNPGEDVTLTVFAEVVHGEISYEWIDWDTLTPLEGEKESVFTIDAIQKNARFFCRVRDDFGNEKHCYFTIYVDNGLEILETSEAAPTVEFGQTTQLSVTAKAKTGELTYAWYKDGNIIEGANESVYTTEAIEKFTGYYCQVTDIYGNTQTAWFSVYVDNRLEIVSTSESEPIVAYGQTTELSVTAKANTGELTYEWYKDGNGIEGANGSVYKTEPIECYTTYQCHVTDVFGNTTSAWFYVFVDNGLEHAI